MEKHGNDNKLLRTEVVRLFWRQLAGQLKIVVSLLSFLFMHLQITNILFISITEDTAVIILSVYFIQIPQVEKKHYYWLHLQIFKHYFKYRHESVFNL